MVLFTCGARKSAARLGHPCGKAAKALDDARRTLEHHGDRVNAAHARYLEAQRLLLTGRLDDAERLLGARAPAPLPPALRTAHALVSAGIALRRVRAVSPANRSDGFLGSDMSQDDGAFFEPRIDVDLGCRGGIELRGSLARGEALGRAVDTLLAELREAEAPR